MSPMFQNGTCYNASHVQKFHLAHHCPYQLHHNEKLARGAWGWAAWAAGRAAGPQSLRPALMMRHLAPPCHPRREGLPRETRKYRS